jgi:hypothetical protein
MNRNRDQLSLQLLLRIGISRLNKQLLRQWTRQGNRIKIVSQNMPELDRS